MNENQVFSAAGNPDTEYEQVVTFNQWFKTLSILFLNLIPMVGPIIALVLFIVKATDIRQPRTLRNALIAGFIISGISLVLTITAVVVSVAVIASMPEVQHGLDQIITEYYSML